MKAKNAIDVIFADVDIRGINSETSVAAARGSTENNIMPSTLRRDVTKNSSLLRKRTKGETSQLRSVVGALSWATRQCKPELFYRVSKLQTTVHRANVLHFKEADRGLEDAVEIADRGLAFKGGAAKWDSNVSAQNCRRQLGALI